MASLVNAPQLLVAIFASIILVCQSSQQTSDTQAGSPSAINPTTDNSYFFYQSPAYPRDCQQLGQQCSSTNFSGVHVIKPDGFQEPFEVFCERDVAGGDWTVIQRREDIFVNFNRSWAQYRNGFGFQSTDFWLGNEKLSFLTNQGAYELRIDLELSTGESFYTTYKGFRISDEFGGYKLTHVGAVQSNIGALISACPQNMIYGACTCQTTCEDPEGSSGCHGNCSDRESCICPDRFLMQGNQCVPKSECGCFLQEESFLIPEGDVFINDDCTLKCLCNNSQLDCNESYTCGDNAECDVTNDVRQCSCIEGYAGDGQTCEALYRDCKDVYDAGYTQDGVYTILPYGWPGMPFTVYCKMDNGGGWTVFQRRIDGSTDFQQNWNTYRDGFGDINANFWLGNEKLYYLTNQGEYELRFDVTTSSGSLKYAEYPEFQIESESTDYRINKLGNRRSGNTGGHLPKSRGKQFSTHDRDNDDCPHFHCAQGHRSGWWYYTDERGCRACANASPNFCDWFQYNENCYSRCSCENLNGVYNGAYGENIYSDCSDNCNLRAVEIKIRPSS